MVIQFQYDPHGYASALLMLEKTNYAPRPLAVAAAGKKSDLLYRIECMLGVQKKQVISFNKLAGLFAGLLCFIAVNAVLIAGRHSGKDANGIASLSEMSSPLYFFADGSESKSLKPVPAPQVSIPTVVNHASKQTLPVKEGSKRTYEMLPRVPLHIDIPSASYT